MNVFNCVATILPYTVKKYKNCFIDLRIKKDYSPQETQEITGRKLKIPYRLMENEYLRLYEWRGLLFSVLNCFELADIEKRTIFKGFVDFLVTIEYNKAVNYFSSISDSLSRDIHSYIIQVNTSNYGDSRITQPSETFIKDIVKIKGGDNVSIITGKIDVDKLRSFQKKKYSLQEKNKEFKPTPPNYTLYSKRKRSSIN